MEKEQRRLIDILEELEVELKKAYWLNERSTWYVLWRQFIAGIARGLGTAFGATIVAAVVFYLIAVLARLNLPVLSDFLARLVKLIKLRM
jgi:hypothetical protein